jgi:AraC-like DNA-binding protein
MTTVRNDSRARWNRGVAPCSLQVGAGSSAIYQEYLPPPGLEPYAVCAWTVEVPSGGRAHRQRVLPDGCSDIIWIGESLPIVVGPMTRAAPSTLDAGTTVFGLRLRPEASGPVLGIPAEALADRRIPLDGLWRRPDVEAASAQLWEQRTPAGRIAVVQRLVSSRQNAIVASDPAVRHAIAKLSGVRPERVGKLARQIGISERQLRRRFTAVVGYTPKTFQRIVRFQALLALASRHQAPEVDDCQVAGGLAELAHYAGYADQAHMTREVCEFAGVPPSALLGKVVSALSLYDLTRSDLGPV